MMHVNKAIQAWGGVKGYHNISDGDSLYRYKRLSTGMNMNAPEQYQNIIRLWNAIADCPGATNIADDIVVYEWTTEEHDRN